MVKGRRVRAVVACTAPTDDCCSPNPKRRGQKIHLKSVLQQNQANSTITTFFQNIDETKPIADDELKTLVKKEEELLTLFHENNLDKHVENDICVPTTPVMLRKFDGQQTTPHRIIELTDNNNGKGGEEKDGELSNQIPQMEVKATEPKTKKRQNVIKDTNHKLTEYFPVRRSVRKTKKTVLEEKQRSLEQLVRSESEDGLAVRVFNDKGRGVVASKSFDRGDFVVEYSGDLIDMTEAKRREVKYAQDKNAGCYMYYFKHNNQQYCVDATAESGKLGRLVNHSRNGNLMTRTISIDNKPRLVLIAKDNIKEGDELTYDYGDRSKESLKHHPWLAY